MTGLEEKDKEWLEKEANAGNAEAMWTLAGRYSFEKDEKKSDYWFNRAAEKYRQMAEAGDTEAMYRLADCYIMGLGVEYDEAKFIYWYEKAADEGIPEAMLALGDCYVFSKELGCDYEQAANWYKKAAEAGSAAAMYKLAVFYDEGLGLDKDAEKAAYWYKKAADAGDETAIEKLQEKKGNEKADDYEKIGDEDWDSCYRPQIKSVYLGEISDNDANAGDLAESIGGTDIAIIAFMLEDQTAVAKATALVQSTVQANILTLIAVIVPPSYAVDEIISSLEENGVLLKSAHAIIPIMADSEKTAAGYAGNYVSDLISGINNLTDSNGMIGLDFADLKAVLGDAGLSSFSLGRASGDNAAASAMRQAIESSPLKTIFSKATAIVFNLAASENLMSLTDVSEASELIQQAVNPAAEIIFAAQIDNDLGDNYKITLIVGGFADEAGNQATNHGFIWSM